HAAAATAWGFAPDLLSWLGAKGATHDYAVSYFRIVVPAMPISTIGMMCSGLLRAHGDARRAMTVTLVAGLVNAILDPIFIFGFGWGLEGAAIASVCARFATLATALTPVIRHYGGFAPFEWSRFKTDLAPILAITIPAVLTNVATPVGNFIVTRTLAPFGDAAVAGLAVMGRMTPLAFCVIFALSGAVGPIIGQNFGARQFSRVRETLSRTMMFAGGYVVVAWAVLLLINGFVADQFRLSGEGREIVFWFSVAVAPLFIFNGSLFISNAAFNNLKRPIWSTLLNWGKNTIGVAPFVIVGAQIGGASGVIIAQAIGGIFFGMLGLWLAYRLVSAYENGDVDPDIPWRPPLWRRPEAPFASRHG
ncbi:MAG: MATE family efflux transporter, partial [Pseudomonadota bacterium]